jgi:hypothetical protein
VKDRNFSLQVSHPGQRLIVQKRGELAITLFPKLLSNVLLTPSSAAFFAEVGRRSAAELQRGYIEPYGPNKIPTS